MLTEEAIQKIADIAATKTYEVDGRTLSSRQLFNLPSPVEPKYPTVRLTTLDGLARFVEEVNSDDIVKGKAHIVVEATRVWFQGPPFGVNRERDCYAEVFCKVEPFKFGDYCDLETFRVMLLSRFVDSRDREAILNFISKLNDEATKSLIDDGVTQSVNVKVGIATTGPAKVPSPCGLQPLRTFSEIDQPEGVFIFRLRKGALGPEAALFEIYTGWELLAAKRIALYLERFTALEGVPIYA